MQEKIAFNFYGIGVQIKGLNENQYSDVLCDFSFFCYQASDKVSKWIHITTTKMNDLSEMIPKNITATKQTANSIYYDVGDIRYNDYYGKALSIINYNTETINIYYKDEQYFRELLYLIILSRTGKYLDRSGKHKIHACGVNYKNCNLLLMMGSKGGKTSTFCELISSEDVSIISDDTPMITNKGEILPFPLRIGAESKEFLKEKFPYIEDKDLSQFKREYFNQKYLLNIDKLKNKIEVKAKRNILMVGVRSTFETPQFSKISKFEMFFHLLEHMIVGIGLPMIVEYFLQNTIKDHMVNFTILISRVKASIRVLAVSDCYQISLSSNINENAKKIKEILDER